MNTKVFGAWGIVVAAAIAMSCASSKVTPSGGELGASSATPPAATPPPQTPTPNTAGSALVFIRASVPPPPAAPPRVDSKREGRTAAARQFGTVASRSSEHKFGATAEDGGAEPSADGSAPVAAPEVPPQSPPTMVFSDISVTRLPPEGRAAIPSDDAGVEKYTMKYKDEALTFEGGQLVPHQPSVDG